MMATITQLVPIAGSVSENASGNYTAQINTTGGIAPPTFLTTAPSIEVNVTSSGLVEATGPLQPGEYSVAGTVSDNFGNSGVWAFLLTVTGITSPAVSVTPATAAAPTGWEIAVPFHIDPATGGTAFLDNYLAIIEQHVVTIIMTALNERVMLPDYGGDLTSHIFDVSTEFALGTFDSDLKNKIAQWEPAVTIQSIQATANSQQNQVNVTVEFMVDPFTDLNSVTVTAGGSVYQVVAS